MPKLKLSRAVMRKLVPPGLDPIAARTDDTGLVVIVSSDGQEFSFTRAQVGAAKNEPEEIPWRLSDTYEEQHSFAREVAKQNRLRMEQMAWDALRQATKDYDQVREQHNGNGNGQGQQQQPRDQNVTDIWEIAQCRLEEAQQAERAHTYCDCLTDGCGRGHTPGNCMGRAEVLASQAYGTFDDGNVRRRALCEPCAKALISGGHKLGVLVLDFDTEK